LLIPLICSFGVLIFDGLPRFFLLSSPFVDATSFCIFGATTTFLIDGVVSPVFGGRPRARFGVSELLLITFVEPADFGGRPRPFFAPVFFDDDNGLFSPSSKIKYYLFSNNKKKELFTMNTINSYTSIHR
jgi:hypothetical protein